jgi:hypothetical protein
MDLARAETARLPKQLSFCGGFTMTSQLRVTNGQYRNFSFVPLAAFTAVFSALLMPLGMTTASGQVVVEVQEDWEVVIGAPDLNTAAPQITCIISPNPDVNGLHAALELNQQTWPHYTPGGVQLHTWDGEYLMDSQRYPTDEVLNTSGETITWTMRMAMDGQDVIFDVDNAVSSTWGNFGANGELWIQTRAPSENLNHYNPDVSVQNSCVGYAGNRVQSLTLKEVRYYVKDALGVLTVHATDPTDRVVHQQ